MNTLENEKYTLEDLEKDFLEKNKNYKWKIFDKWFPKGIADLRAFYAISHPWKIVEYWIDQFQYAWDRVFVGYDKRVSWSIDFYLAENLPLWLKKLKEKKQGVSLRMFEESDWDKEKYEYPDEAYQKAKIKFDNILDQMIDGFRAYTVMSDISIWKDDPGYAELNDKFNIAMRLFVENFSELYD